MGVDISFSGVSDLIDELERMVNNASAIENDALAAAAEPILADAQETAAFRDRSGKLRKSLTLSKVKIKSGKKYILAGSFDDSVFYARMVEYGTSKAAAHPFLNPAFERHKSEAEQIIINKLQEALK